MGIERFYIGIDVGTGSARAGIFNRTGRMLATAEHPIRMWRPQTDFVEQSTDDIWRACCKSVREAVKLAKVRPVSVIGLGFDATCSLAILDEHDKPITVSPSGRDAQNVIVWMDHRAIDQAERINRTQHKVLNYVGGVISPEMQSPKLLWLKENMPTSWKRTARFLDLPDFLTYRATGKDVRSLCSTVCKWTYLGHKKQGWRASYWKRIGLIDFVKESFERIGTEIRPMGESIGQGLSQKAAVELGLKPGTAVGVSIIDAHAGGLGMLGAKLDGKKPSKAGFNRRLALIGGTSSCHLAVSAEPRFIPGVWGPYYSAMVPGLWLNEGGQSATGSLIDHMIFSHVRNCELNAESKKTGKTVYDLLNARLAKLAKTEAFPAALARELHVLPYFHGNRSPRANPKLRGMISGLKLSDTVDDLALLYLATVQAIAHGTRHIIEEMNAKGYRINTIFACGGGIKNPVFLREHADITGCSVVLPKEPEAVLLGSAILGGVASSDFKTVTQAMAAMNRATRTITPVQGQTRRFHDYKYKVFHRLYKDQQAYRKFRTATD